MVVKSPAGSTGSGREGRTMTSLSVSALGVGGGVFEVTCTFGKMIIRSSST